jgi:hypothetical protein
MCMLDLAGMRALEATELGTVLSYDPSRLLDRELAFVTSSMDGRAGSRLERHPLPSNRPQPDPAPDAASFS